MKRSLLVRTLRSLWCRSVEFVCVYKSMHRERHALPEVSYYSKEDVILMDMELIYIRVLIRRTFHPVPVSAVDRSLFFCQYGTDAEVCGFFNESITEYFTLPVVPMLGEERTFDCFLEKMKDTYANLPCRWSAIRLTRDNWHACVSAREKEMEELTW